MTIRDLRALPPGPVATAVVALVFAALPEGVSAHSGGSVVRDGLWREWDFNPLILLPLIVLACLYARGLAVLWRRAGVGRAVRLWQVAAFAGGIVALVGALLSPLDALGGALFAAHMGQHLTLTLVAAPLLVLGAPTATLLWSLPNSWRRALPQLTRRPLARMGGRMLTTAAAAVVAHSAVIWLWHVPGLYEAAIRSEAVHAIEHVSFLATAALFWWVIVHAGVRRGSSHPVAVLAVFAMALQGSALGALLTFSPAAWYSTHADGAATWGLSMLEDQQLAGLIMWIPSGLIYTGVALTLVAKWLGDMDRRSIPAPPPPSVPPASHRAGIAP